MKFHFAALLSLLLCFSACDDNSAGNQSTGTLNGNTRLFDEKGSEISDKSGISVSLKERPISTITTASGAWQLKDVPMGTYTILFAKPGFDTAMVFGFQFNGYGDVWVDQMIELLKPAPGSIIEFSTSIRSTQDSGTKLILIPKASPEAILHENSSFSYVVNLSKNANFVWVENGDNYIQEFWDGPQFENSIILEELQEKFNSGNTVYISARLMHRRYGVRADNFGRRYYPGLGAPSNTTSFVMP